jgi:ABC-2 type transport system permease protein
MPGYLQAVARVMPLTYAIRGLRDIMLLGQGLEAIATELAALAGFAALMIALAALTVRRT